MIEHLTGIMIFSSNAEVAQLVERRLEEAKVVDSITTLGTIPRAKLTSALSAESEGGT